MWKKVTKRKIGSTYVVHVDGKPTQIGITRNSQREFRGSADWDVTNLSNNMKYFSMSSLGGAFDMVKSFIAGTDVQVIDGVVPLNKPAEQSV